MIVLDIEMEEMDGYEVARAVRTGFPERRPTIIALTGHGQPEDRRKAREAGFDHHLVKPAQLDVLQALLADSRGAPRHQRNRRRSRARCRPPG